MTWFGWHLGGRHAADRRADAACSPIAPAGGVHESQRTNPHPTANACKPRVSGLHRTALGCTMVCRAFPPMGGDRVAIPTQPRVGIVHHDARRAAA